MTYRCFRKGCELEVQYVCCCLCFETYSCEFHLQMHLILPNRIHNFNSILVKPTEGTKCAILEFLEKEKSKRAKLKKIALAVINKNYSNHKDAIKENLERLNSDLKEISDLIKKFSKFLQKEKDSLENPLILGQDKDNSWNKVILSKDSELYRSASLFCELFQLRNKRSEILNRANNEWETEQDFRRTCLWYEKNSPNLLFSQAYQEYINAYQKIAYTYLIKQANEKFNLFIYDTESEKEEVKILEISNKFRSKKRFIVKLPNSELFLINSTEYYTDIYIVDKNFLTKNLPSVKDECCTCIYFNRSVYYFMIYSNYMQVRRFDLTEYRWTRLLAKIKYKYLESFESVTFNSSILVSNFSSCYLLLYSVDIDSFTEISYKFSKNKRKIMVYGEGRLYLIESNSGWIYESEVGDEYAWNKIARSVISWNPDQLYCSYNKGGFYISLFHQNKALRFYYKFDLSQKTLIDIACYDESLALRRLDGKIEAIECYGQAFKLDPDHFSAYIQKRYSLYHLVENFEKLEKNNELIKKYPDKSYNYLYKGDSLCDLGRYLDAIECYDKGINLDPKNWNNYVSKGDALSCLGRNTEAIGYYNKAIKLNRINYNAYIRKANALYGMVRILEEIECYSEVIKLEPNYKDAYIWKADALYDLGRYLEAIECYNELIKLDPEEEYSYIRKADALHSMGTNFEAQKWFNEAIEFNSNNPIYFCYRANMLNDLGEIVKAIQDFNIAYKLFFNWDFDECNDLDELFVEDCLELLKILSKLLKTTVEFEEKIQEIKGSRLMNSEIFYEIEQKEAKIKEKHSQLVKRAIKCIDWKRRKLPKQIEQTKEEITEHQKVVIDELAQLSLLLCAQDNELKWN